MGASGGDHGGGGAGFHERRGAAAEEDASQPTVRRRGGVVVEFSQQRIAPAGVVDGLGYVAVEIAIGAFRLAERPMNIKGDGIGHALNNTDKFWQRKTSGQKRL